MYPVPVLEESGRNIMENTRKAALVTGAGAGIGRAIAIRLAKDGFGVAVNDVRPEKASQVSAEIRDRGFPSIAVPGDVSDAGQVNDAVDKAMGAFQRIDVLVNNAGICPIRPLFEITAEDMLSTFKVNVVSMLLCTQAVSRHMIRQGGGKIINAASQAAYNQSSTGLEYGASKWAVRGLTRSLAISLAPYNITVNAYCPGVVYTDMQVSIIEKVSAIKGITPEEYKAMKTGDIPLGRLIPIEDIAAFVSFLASDGADNITGQSMLINGGQIMQ